MKLRNALVALVLVSVTSIGYAQQQTGEIFGRASDKSGAILPGVTVTVAGPALIQPRVVTTSETGSYRAPELPIGLYTVTFELPGFRTLAYQDVRVNIGFNAQVNGSMELSAVQETVTVTGESPIIDTKETGTKTTFDLETMQNLPSARDPWVMLERTPAITMDRVNVGGNQSGQQSGYISRGSSTGNNKWSIDGVDITDMAATGASPIYYDFDMLEEMQVTTGGAGVEQQTAGVGINLVTRSGTDRLKGSGRAYVTDQKFQGDNITEELRLLNAGSGSPIQNIKDYGFEVGGPIKKGKAWFWGSYGTQDIKVGVVGFYKNNATCRPNGVAINPRTTDTELLRSCLETDLTTLNNYNWKVTLVPFNNNRFNFQNTWAEKVRNARDAGDLRPIETTYRQKAVSSQFGRAGWLTGPSPFWKAADQHVINDRWLVDVMWSHLGNNFVLDFHEDELADVQAMQQVSNGLWARSFQASSFLRPTNSFDLTSSYFLPSTMGGDHAFKFGYRWRSAHSTSLNHHGGFIDARFQTTFDAGCTTAASNCSADLWRDQNSISHLDTQAFYLQDTFTKNRLTLNLGFRLDIQDDSAEAAQVPANPFFPTLLPAIDFRGADAGVTWKDFSPRLGFTYDVTGDGRNIFATSYSTYYGQMGPGQLSSQLAATGAVFVRYPWIDANADKFVQVNEVNTSVPVISKTGSFDPANPTNTGTASRIDPNVKNDRTREFIVGFDRQLRANMAVGASYIWRKYDQFLWNDRDNLTSADYRAVTFTPPTSSTSCAGIAARCETVTYFEPTFQLPSPNIYTNVPDRFRDFNGFELTFNRRHSGRWSMNASYAFNSAVDHWDSAAAYEDPTNIENLEGAQYAPESAGSGQGNVFTNAKWLVKVGGRYTLPYDINLAGFFNARQGYPFPQAVLVSRLNGAGNANILLDPLGDVRLDTLKTIDFRIDKVFRFGRANIVPTFEVFNLANANTVTAINRLQAAANANTVSGIIAPRVARFGLQVKW